MLLQPGMGWCVSVLVHVWGGMGVLCRTARMGSTWQQSAWGEVAVMTWLQERPTEAPSPQWWPSPHLGLARPSTHPVVLTLLPAQPGSIPL